jgi:hypothetical protein
MNHNYNKAIWHVICAKNGYGDNIDNLRRALDYIQKQIRILEGRPDPNQTDLFKNKGENDD